MKRHTYRDIKTITKDRVNDRFGDALLMILIPGLIIATFGIFINTLTVFLDTPTATIINTILRSFFNLFATYATTVMIIKFAKGRDGFSLTGVFNHPSRLLRFVLYSILLSIFSLITLIPLYDYIKDFIHLYTATTDPEILSNYVVNYMENNPGITHDLYVFLGLNLVFSLIVIKFRFTTYLIIDKGTSIVESMKKSWELTNGNYFRILFFPFAFFFWFLLGIFTCFLGFIYVIPLMTVAHVYLYLIILEEKGEKDLQPDYTQEKNDYYNTEFDNDPLSY